MHTVKVLHTLLRQSVPSIHATRLDSIVATVQSIVYGARAGATGCNGTDATGRDATGHTLRGGATGGAVQRDTHFVIVRCWCNGTHTLSLTMIDLKA
jgi:hypothetical protein